MELIKPTDSLIFLFSFSVMFSMLNNVNTSRILYSLLFSSVPLSILFYNRRIKSNSIINKKENLDKIIKSQLKSPIIIESLSELKILIYEYSPVFYKEILFLCICIDNINNTTNDNPIKYDISMLKIYIKKLNNTISSLIFNLPKLEKEEHRLFTKCITEIQNESERIISLLCNKYHNHWESGNIDRTDSPHYLSIPHSNIEFKIDKNAKIMKTHMIHL